MFMKYVAKIAKCDICQKDNTEFVIYSKDTLFGLTNIEIHVCQSCVSKQFREFKKEIKECSVEPSCTDDEAL